MNRIKWSSFVKATALLLLVEVVSASIGAFIGFWQAAIAERRSFGLGFGFAPFGAFAGASIAGILGPVLFYSLFRRTLTFGLVLKITAICLVTGALAAYFVKVYSIYVTPWALVLAAWYYHDRRGETKQAT